MQYPDESPRLRINPIKIFLIVGVSAVAELPRD